MPNVKHAQIRKYVVLDRFYNSVNQFAEDIDRLTEVGVFPGGEQSAEALKTRIVAKQGKVLEKMGDLHHNFNDNDEQALQQALMDERGY